MCLKKYGITLYLAVVLFIICSLVLICVEYHAALCFRDCMQQNNAFETKMIRILDSNERDMVNYGLKVQGRKH